MAGPKEPTVSVRHIRKIPRIRISKELADEVGEIATRAADHARKRDKMSADPEGESMIFLHGTAGLAVENAINHYASQVGYEIPSPQFRDLVKPSGALSKSIKGLKDHLDSYLSPSDQGTDDNLDPYEFPPFEQMRSLYCFDNSESDGIDLSREKREALWDRQLSPSTMKACLALWLRLLDDLHKRAGSRRPPISAQRDFVRELAGYWKSNVKHSLGSSRNEAKSRKPGGDFDEHGQRGLFAHFIYAAAKGIPNLGTPTKDLKWDHVIREISEENG
jgi:hypothetical protein